MEGFLNYYFLGRFCTVLLSYVGFYVELMAMAMVYSVGKFLNVGQQVKGTTHNTHHTYIHTYIYYIIYTYNIQHTSTSWIHTYMIMITDNTG